MARSKRRVQPDVMAGGEVNLNTTRFMTTSNFDVVDTFRERLLKLLHVMLSLSEHWILVVSVMVTSDRLSTLYLKYTSEVAFVSDCTCSCEVGAQTIEDCYALKVSCPSASPSILPVKVI